MLLLYQVFRSDKIPTLVLHTCSIPQAVVAVHLVQWHAIAPTAQGHSAFLGGNLIFQILKVEVQYQTSIQTKIVVPISQHVQNP